MALAIRKIIYPTPCAIFHVWLKLMLILKAVIACDVSSKLTR